MLFSFSFTTDLGVARCMLFLFRMLQAIYHSMERN